MSSFVQSRSVKILFFTGHMTLGACYTLGGDMVYIATKGVVSNNRLEKILERKDNNNLIIMVMRIYYGLSA